MERFYSFDNIRNFRDFGDYDTANGGRIAKGRLFRSGHLADASDNDLETIRELNIGLIVDLRHMPERMRQPNRWPAGQNTITLEYPDPEGSESQAVAPHEAFMRETLTTPDDARNYMNGSYAARPDDAGFRQIFSDTLRHMVETGDNILIHCAAGKDRTGTLGAIIHSALGVSANVTMEDYMLTMDAVDVESFLEPAAKMMGKRFGRPYSPDALRPMFGVEPGYLENSLNAIGDMDAYIAGVLGISPDDRARLREQYVQN